MSDGTRPYPPIEEKEDISPKGGKGMSFELRYIIPRMIIIRSFLIHYLQFINRDVSFSYPGSQKGEDAINKVSMSIKSGQLVVVVGANGSGKSTIVRILSRLYDPTSGETLIDGHPSSCNRTSEPRY
jgi:ABC-type multidrug transport system fused ATPase/permease subunit